MCRSSHSGPIDTEPEADVTRGADLADAEAVTGRLDQLVLLFGHVHPFCVADGLCLEGRIVGIKVSTSDASQPQTVAIAGHLPNPPLALIDQDVEEPATGAYQCEAS